jgi:hypothetical protein
MGGDWISSAMTAQSVSPLSEPSTATAPAAATQRSCTAVEATPPPLPLRISARSVNAAPGV